MYCTFVLSSLDSWIGLVHVGLAQITRAHGLYSIYVYRAGDPVLYKTEKFCHLQLPTHLFVQYGSLTVYLGPVHTRPLTSSFVYALKF